MARITVLGRSGTGKSYYLLEQSCPSFNLTVHYDVEDEEPGLSDSNHNPLYQTLTVDAKTANKISWGRCLLNHPRLRVVPDDLTQDEQRVLYAEICRQAFRICKRRKNISGLVSCDEAHNVLTQHDFPTPCERLITGGRKHGLECLHISQRPQLLHSTVISQADKRVYFAISDSNDLKKIDKTSNFPASKLKALPKRTCIVENKDSGEWIEVETDGVGRERPHYSGDDGVLDQHLPV